MDTGNALFLLVPFGIVLLSFIVRFRHLRKSWWRSLLIALPCLWAYAYLLNRLDSTGTVVLGGYGRLVFMTYLALFTVLAGFVVIIYSLQPRTLSDEARAENPLNGSKVK